MNVESILANAVGIVGVGLLLGAYFLLQKGAVGSHSMIYLLMNIAASVCFLVSLSYDPNIPMIITQICWIAISLYGMVKAFRIPPHSDKPEQEPDA